MEYLHITDGAAQKISLESPCHNPPKGIEDDGMRFLANPIHLKHKIGRASCFR